MTECKYPTCSEEQGAQNGYSGKFCSKGHEIKYEHIKADARDARRDARAGR